MAAQHYRTPPSELMAVLRLYIRAPAGALQVLIP